MMRFLSALFLATFLCGLGTTARAADAKDAKAILDKAIKALGGEDKLSKAEALTWKAKGVISFGGNDNKFTSQTTVQGLDHFRNEFEGEFGGNPIKGVVVLNGDKAWRKFGDMGQELDAAGLANEKRSIYLTLVPTTILPLKSKGFHVEVAPEEKVGDKAAVVLKVTGPDGKDFKVYLDKETSLPVKQVAKVVGFMGEEFTQETTFSDYKDFDGIKKATKVENKRDGEKFLATELTEFKVLDKVDPKTFAEPQ
jgi:hypothetical protein